MPIVGTAGHVDHGKSTLVRALTGIDPDRLAEEKRRGMTIDLGFAHLDLPSGERVGIVDVPGHARFLHNMLAGVHGMDAVLLVVAADEGVMPQTREHLDILQLLGVRRVLVALTKVDLVEPGLVQLAAAEIHAELSRHRIEATMVPVSAPRREGLPELVHALGLLVAEAQPVDRGRPRLPVDRSFTTPGFGTVVTGSLVDGALRVGQLLELVPAAGRPRTVRVRGLQQHGRAVDEARPGSRVAANLQGIDHQQVARGQVLAPPGSLRASRRLDARVSVLEPGLGLPHNSQVRVYCGTAEVSARVVLLESGDLAPGSEGFVQLRLAAPAAVRDGDRLVLRRLSPSAILAGGAVVDSAAPLHRRGAPGGAVEALRLRGEARYRGLQELGRGRQGGNAATVAAALSEDLAMVTEMLEALVAAGEAVRVGDTHWDATLWAELVRRTGLELDAFHRRQPLRTGQPTEELRGRLGLDPRQAADVLATMDSAGIVERRAGGVVALAGWQPRLTDAQRRRVEAILEGLGAAPLAPPRLSQLAEGDDAGAICQYLEEAGLIVRIAPDVYLLAGAIASAREVLVEHLRA
ncbi:MAG: selenocysteine-specific translation elongation factor, partial [Candidatus Dormibacteraeota bacterium]|nr:selenocysteine-specific translation elongation factor [Candidatus Dormibacteraeota bacterium]